MSTKSQDKQEADEKKQDRQRRNAVVGEHVMRSLGQPNELRGVQVRRLWADYYRVNILVGADIASVKVAHSFFLETDDAGNIITSNPKITRRYEREASKVVDVQAGGAP